MDSDSLLDPGELPRAMDYRIDPTGILWKCHKQVYLPCIPESKVLEVLKKTHDEGG